MTRVVVHDARTSGAVQAEAYATFGQAFRRGDVPKGATLVAHTSAGDVVPLQVDAKATFADGSLRHAVLTAKVANLSAGASVALDLITAATSGAPTPIKLSTLAGTDFDAEVRLTLPDGTYTASVKPLLGSGGSPWLEGPLATEAAFSVPLESAEGKVHPHLHARFNVRMYAGAKSARVDFIVENDWAYAVGPRNYTYDAALWVGGKPVYTKEDLVHTVRARWRQTLEWGANPALFVAEDPAYLMATGAVPNYDPAVIADPGILEGYEALAPWEPMTVGLANPYMPSTGGRPDIGILPGWAVLHLISMDPRAAKANLITAEGSASWPIHFRDEATDLPVSLDDHPYMSILANPGDMVNPETKVSDQFPACGGDCASAFSPDTAHAPSFVYLPYLLTGDRYYLEELQFWANYHMLQSNPWYRGTDKGLVRSNQVRGQAWSLRALADAAAFTPDADPLKSYFVKRVGYNLEDYGEQYLNGGQQQNALGAILDHAIIYRDGRGLAAWQDDFFTSAVGHLVELGFDDAKPLLTYKSTMPVGRMVGDGFCWITASSYEFIVRDSSTAPLYTTFAEVYTHSAMPEILGLSCNSPEMAAALNLKVGEMMGYASSADGFPSNLQPALAMAVDAGAPGAADAWKLFAGRPVQPTKDYGVSPQFAIVPR
ncbi:MAG: hypothetical protein LC111_14780 [Bacteroidia bacterium]|nr:hypothetical protein [Bacteroidia bacterium]